MSKEPQREKETTIAIQLPRTGFPRVMYFNRFRVEKVEGMHMMDFGLFVPSTGLTDYFCCSMSGTALKEQSANIMPYLERMGRSTEEPPAWQGGLPVPRKIEVADFINFVHQGGTCEIVFAVSSLWAVHVNARASAAQRKPLEAQPVAILRCELEIQRQFIEALYA